jgi:hypothetical protein
MTMPPVEAHPPMRYVKSLILNRVTQHDVHSSQRVTSLSELLIAIGLPALITAEVWVDATSKLVCDNNAKPAIAIPAINATTTIFKCVARSALYIE